MMITYSYYIKDVIDGRGEASVASKNNDGIIDVTLGLRFKLISVKKTHVKNISSLEVAESLNARKSKTRKDTIVISHVDTLYINTTSVATNAVQAINDNFVYVYFDHIQDVFECLEIGGNIYALLGAGESIVRERVFTELATLMDCDYEHIYYQWRDYGKNPLDGKLYHDMSKLRFTREGRV